MKYNKLVRNSIPELIASRGQMSVTRILKGSEYTEELRKKLLEEAAEAATSNSLEDLVDVIEVAYALAEDFGTSGEQLEQMRLQEEERRGSFSEKIYLIEVKERV